MQTTSFSVCKKIIALLTALLVGFSILYGFFLQQTISGVVQRKQMNKKITQLRSQIGDAENRFGTKIDAATKENAKELGFRFLDSQQYLTQVPSDDTLVTLNAPSN